MVFRGLFGSRPKRLGDGERRSRRSAIEDRLRRLSPVSAARHLAEFFRRYDEAMAAGEDEAKFFDEEERGLSALEAKLAAQGPAKPRGVVDTPTFDAIAADHLKRLTPYPEADLGPAASGDVFREVRHLTGAMTRFESAYLPLLLKAARILRDRSIEKDLQACAMHFRDFIPAAPGQPSRVLERPLRMAQGVKKDDDLQKILHPVLRETWALLAQVRKLGQELRRHPKASSLRMEIKGRTVPLAAAPEAALQEIADLFRDFRLRGLDGF